MKNKGQAWGFDLFAAIFIFLGGIVIFYFYSLNYPSEGTNTLQSLSYEGNLIAEMLLTEGYPQNWNENNVVRIGIMSNNKINQTKLELFHNLTLTDNNYKKTQGIFTVRNNYFISPSKPFIINNIGVNLIGRNYTDNSQNIIKISRLTIYKDEPITLNIYIWN